MYRHHDYLGSLIRQRHEKVLHEGRMRRLAQQARVDRGPHGRRARADRTWRSVLSLLRKAEPVK